MWTSGTWLSSSCMCVCVCIRMHVCALTCICICAYAHMFVHLYMWLCPSVWLLGCSHQHSMAEDTKASGPYTLLCHACLSPHTPQQNVGSTLPLTLRINRLPHEREMGARHACSPSLAFFLSRWYIVVAGNAWQHARLEPGTLWAIMSILMNELLNEEATDPKLHGCCDGQPYPPAWLSLGSSCLCSQHWDLKCAITLNFLF